MIVVTGAAGHLGRVIVTNLIARVPSGRVGASARDPAKVADLEALGVRVRCGDFDDIETIKHSFEGATQVLIVSSNARAFGGDPLAQHRNAINAARAVGVKRIVYTSHMAAGPTSLFPPILDHAATEVMLADSGLAWTALRNGFYAASGIALMGDALKTGVIETPADGKISWTAHGDLAEAAAIILADEGRYDGSTPPLTGSQSLNYDDVAEMVSKLINKPMRHEVLTDEALRAKIVARGAPEAAVNILLGLYRASRKGEFATVDPTLTQLLGRNPITMRELIAEKVR